MNADVSTPRTSWLLPAATILFMAVTTGLALRQPVFAVGLIYCVVFFAVSLWKPWVPMAAILAGAPLMNDLSGGVGAKYSIAEVNLILAGVLLAGRVLITKQGVTLGPLLWPLVLYLFASLCSAMYVWLGKPAVLSMMQMLLYLGLAVLVFANLAERGRDYLPAFYSLLAVAMVLSIIAVSTRQMYILGLHKNSLGQALSCALVCGVELILSSRSRSRSVFLMIAILVVSAGLVMSLSRGAWMSAALGITFVLVVRRSFGALFKLALLMIPIIALCWQLVPAERQEYATEVSDRKFSSLYYRLENIKWAQERFDASPILGSGLGIRKTHDATNLLWFTLAETGIFGLITLLALILTIFRMVLITAKIMPPTDEWYSGLVLAGAILLGKVAHGMVDHFWSRGHLLIACAAIGMALRAYLVAQARQREEAHGTRRVLAQC